MKKKNDPEAWKLKEKHKKIAWKKKQELKLQKRIAYQTDMKILRKLRQMV